MEGGLCINRCKVSRLKGDVYLYACGRVATPASFRNSWEVPTQHNNATGRHASKSVRRGDELQAAELETRWRTSKQSSSGMRGRMETHTDEALSGWCFGSNQEAPRSGP